MEHHALVQLALRMGATKATVIPQEKIVLSSEFRKICEGNGCGMYNKTWMCSTAHIGDIDTLMDKVRSYKWALWYQLIGEIEDSYDFEGMTEVGNRFIAMCQRVNEELKPVFGKEMLHLGKGGCGLCKRCTILDNEPCRMPDKALSSLEMYGVDVYRTTEGTGLKYINGPETVTYFGMVLFND
jgi:predicted metal-binding protein